MSKVRIGIIGSRFQAECIAGAVNAMPEESEVVAVASPSKGHAAGFAKRHGIPHAYTDYRELLRDPQVEMISITAPNRLHAQITIDAARAGKHVVCEKPMCLTLEEADAMIDACRTAGVLLLYAEELFFAPKYVKAKQLADEGAFGRVHLVKQGEKHSGPHSDWFWDVERSGGGGVMDLGCHGIAFCWWFLGKQPVRSVYSHMATQQHQARTQGDDEAVTIIEFANGAMGMVESSWNRPGGMDDCIEVFGDKGQTYADLLMGNALPTYSDVGFGYAVEKAATTKGWTYPVFEEHWNYGFPQEMRHFARCVRGKETPVSDGETGRVVQEVLYAAPATVGRLMGFLFVWQFVLSGPLEIASGYIGFSQYLGYIWKGITPRETMLVVTIIGLVNLALLYRRITSIATITVALWVGTLVTVLVVVVTGARHFDARVAFDFPPGAFTFSLAFLMGLGGASRIGVYDYLGYYDVCYIGDEVHNPGRVIPRSILISTVLVALIYLAINLSMIGVDPSPDFVPAASHPQSNFVVSIFMERLYGPGVATAFTAMILWTAFGSVFALLLGYSRVPYAAAKDGYFFKVFARLHPAQGFPNVSLVVLGVLSILAGFVSLGMVIDALITTRILVQFIGQIGAVTLLRRRAPDLPRPFRMWLYPLPSFVALVGWIFIFATTPPAVVAFGLGALLLGVVCFGAWSWKGRTWPFEARRLAV